MAGTRVKIIDAIRAGKNTFSRKEICNYAGLSWGAMYKAMEGLIAEGIVSVSSSKPVGRGRPNVPLILNADTTILAGIDVGATATRLVFTNLEFKTLYNEIIPTPPYPGEDEFWKWLTKVYHTACETGAVDETKILGLGLAISGRVDSEKGIIVSGGNWGMPYGVNLEVSKFADIIGHPVCSCGTRVSEALAEYHFGNQAGRANLVSIGLGVGIASGAVVNHTLLVSHPNRPVGYIGHILIPGNDRDCGCGWHGCLEAYSGGNNLMKVVAEKYPQPCKIRSAADLDKAAANNDPVAQEILNTAALYNAIGIAGMIQLYSPEAVIFSGGQVKRDGYLYRHTLEEVKKMLPPSRRDCVFEITRLGEYQSALGVARMAFENFF